MNKATSNDRIGKIAKQREALRKQVEVSKQKIQQYEDKLASELGQLALTYQLDRLGEEKLKTAFAQIAKDHQLQ